jgi:hypothetical protein
MLSGLQPGVHAGKDIFERDHLDGSGIDFVEAALDLRVPGGFDFGVGLDSFFDEQALDKPVDFFGRQLTGFFEDFLGGAGHVEIVARKWISGHKGETLEQIEKSEGRDLWRPTHFA